MERSGAGQKLLRLQRSWQRTALVTRAAWVLGGSLALVLLLQLWKEIPVLYGVGLFLLFFPVLLLLDRRWRIRPESITRHLNQQYPSLEESSQLLLPSEGGLTALQQLQQRKVSRQLDGLTIRSPFRRSLVRSLLFLLLVMVALAFRPWAVSRDPIGTAGAGDPATAPVRKETVLPAIKAAAVTIIPPRYTGLPSRKQDRFNLQVPSGATVSWDLQLSAAAREVSLLFHDGSRVLLQKTGEAHHWQASRQIRGSGYYQVKIDAQLSELYLMEAVKDKAPQITMQSPPPSLSISYEGAQRFLVQARVMDDYGLSRLSLSATVASGQGEGVKFRDQQYNLGVARGERSQIAQQWLDCRALRMQPGDELYLWLAATDNLGQETRSDVLIVSLEDTTAELTIDGLLKGLDVKPELFRSQRQIIIETEQLLRDRPKLTLKAFQEKSNDLGTDQKLLRLRYGKFLGEEFTSEIGGEQHEEHEEEGETGEKDEATDLMELYGHNHDNAEDASYFDPATKRQLKTMLNEMWNAELKLRTFLPKEALVYENKALRLLKDLQQKSRAYLPKTTFKPTPLQPGKRLTGDVSTVRLGLRQQRLLTDDPLLVLRKAIGTLEELKASGKLTPSVAALLQPAYQQLSLRASSEPATYLEALSSFRRVLNDAFRIRDIRLAQKGLQQMLPDPPSLPHAEKGTGSRLSRSYFENLKKKRT